MFIYTSTKFNNRGKRKKSKQAKPIARRIPIGEFRDLSSSKIPSYRRDERIIPSITSTGMINVSRNSVMEPMNLAKESDEVREAIIAKSKRIAIAYNKGAYQYVTDDTDAKTIGKKTYG